MRSVSIFTAVIAVVLGITSANAANSSVKNRKVSRPMSDSGKMATGSEVPELISFQEFQALDKTQKLYYLTQVRNVVSMISVSSGWEAAENKKKWNLLLEQMIEEAQAKGAAAVAKPIKCPEGQVLQKGWLWSSCVRDQTKCPKNQVAVYATDGANMSCQLVTSGSGQCPEGYSRQESQNNTGANVSYCINSSGVSGGMADISKQFQAQTMPEAPGSPKVEAKPGAEKVDGKVDAKQDEPPKKSATKCWWDEMQKCESSSAKRKEIAKQWYKSKPANGELSCIYGGNVSGYKNPDKPKAGECKPVREAKFGEKTFSCGAGQTLCSPLVFGVEDFAAGKGFCVKGKNATQECATKGTPSGVVGQIANMGTIAAFEWDRLKEGLKNLVSSCILEDKEKNQISISPTAFQCQECQIVAIRVVEMRKALNSRLSELSCDLQANGDVASNATGVKAEPPTPVKSVR